MKSNLLQSMLARLSSGGLGVLVAALGLGFLAVVLVPGLELASELAGSTKALKVLSQQQRYPAVIRSALDSAHERLLTRGYVQESLEQLKEASGKLDAAVAGLASAQPSAWQALVGESALANPVAGSRAALIRDAWSKERELLKPILNYNGVPYQDNESTGTILNEGGKTLERDVNIAIRTNKRAMPLIESELGVVAAELQASSERAASRLRLVLLIGVAIAAILVALVAVLLFARRRQDASLKAARQQTADILRTVKDGLFLLDQTLTIGASHSSAMQSLFGRNDFPGLHFEQLLKHIVPEKTLQTALKFVGVLWSERTKENLVKTINPLGEVEVSVDNGQGKSSTRFLQFEFHRVRVEGKITQVLVSVSDVTARVELARELAISQTQAQSQVDMLLGLLQVEPTQLASFLSDSNAAMKMINAVLREPAREEAAFRKKLDTLFRQVHSVKGEAAALGLLSIESRAHSFEDDLKGLRDKSDLSGNDFLPLVIKLDDLLTHLQSIGDLVARLSRLQMAAADSAHTTTAVIEEGQVVIDQDSVAATTLQQLCLRVASENGKEAILQCSGLDTVPDEYRRVIKDIAIQAVRNAVVHGIEKSEVRAAAGKSSCGAIKIVFQDLGDAGYKLIAEDDGQGLSTERIKQVALKKGFITSEKAQTLDAKQVFALLFQSGFSTLDTATKDAGRGVGMNVIAALMQQVGGKVSVATMPGKFTRLTMTLPPAKRAEDTAAA